jgi:hypothetical protein
MVVYIIPIVAIVVVCYPGVFSKMTNEEIKAAPDYVAVPRARFERFEQVPLAAQELVTAQTNAGPNPNEPGAVSTAREKLRSEVSELEQVWDFEDHLQQQTITVYLTEQDARL